MIFFYIYFMILKKYNSFIGENMDHAKSIIGKKMEAFDKLKTLLAKNLGYIGKFTEYLMNDNIKYSDLVELYEKILDLKTKNATIDISNLSYEKAIDKIIDINNDLSINSLISEFPSEQKKFAKNIIAKNGNDISTYNVLLKVSKKEDIKAFLSKVSRYKDEDSLYSALKVFSKDVNNDRDKVKEVLSNMKSEIVFENDNIMVVKVDSNEDIKILGSDTSWCILSIGMWNQYTKNRLQYIVYDYDKDEFDPTFKIGFTLNKDSTVHAAHDILDNSAGHILKQVFDKNSLVYKDVLPKIKQIEVADISSINAKTGVESLKQLVDDINVDSKEVILGLIVRLFDVFGYRRRTKDGIVNKDITASKLTVLKSLFNKYFYGVSVIKYSDFDNFDDRLLKYVTEKQIFYNRLVDPSKFEIALNSDALSLNLDLCPDQAIVNSTFGVHELISTRIHEYSKPLIDSQLSKSREVLNKLCDRMNKIYSEDEVDYTHRGKSSFEFKMAFLNAILDRREDCPNYENILNAIKSDRKADYPGLFTKYIDLSQVRVTLSSINNNYPIDMIEVKDYPDSMLYITKHSLLNQLPKLLEHLKGKELMLNIRRSELREFNTLDYRSTQGKILIDKLTPEVLRVYNLIKSFPQRVYKDTYKQDGNLKVVVRE